jgi:hypothetical protein
VASFGIALPSADGNVEITSDQPSQVDIETALHEEIPVSELHLIPSDRETISTITATMTKHGKVSTSILDDESLPHSDDGRDIGLNIAGGIVDHVGSFGIKVSGGEETDDVRKQEKLEDGTESSVLEHGTISQDISISTSEWTKTTTHTAVDQTLPRTDHSRDISLAFVGGMVDPVTAIGINVSAGDQMVEVTKPQMSYDNFESSVPEYCITSQETSVRTTTVTNTVTERVLQSDDDTPQQSDDGRDIDLNFVGGVVDSLTSFGINLPSGDQDVEITSDQPSKIDIETLLQEEIPVSVLHLTQSDRETIGTITATVTKPVKMSTSAPGDETLPHSDDGTHIGLNLVGGVVDHVSSFNIKVSGGEETDEVRKEEKLKDDIESSLPEHGTISQETSNSTSVMRRTITRDMSTPDDQTRLQTEDSRGISLAFVDGIVDPVTAFGINVSAGDQMMEVTKPQMSHDDIESSVPEYGITSRETVSKAVTERVSQSDVVSPQQSDDGRNIDLNFVGGVVDSVTSFGITLSSGDQSVEITSDQPSQVDIETPLWEEIHVPNLHLKPSDKETFTIITATVTKPVRVSTSVLDDETLPHSDDGTHIGFNFVGGG